MWDIIKAVLKEKFMIINAYVEKPEGYRLTGWLMPVIRNTQEAEIGKMMF
jgi:hypothetical protein